MTIQVNAGTRLELGSVSSYRTTEFSVENGGTIEINGGVLVVNAGSVLRMRPGSTLIVAGALTVFGGGHVIIEPGAKLDIRPGAALALQDDDSRLTLRGEFVIGANATFQFTGNGYVYFDLPRWTSQGDKNLLLADGSARFVLNGPNPAHRVAEFAPGSYLMPNYWGEFEFTIRNGTVLMGEGASIPAAANFG